MKKSQLTRRGFVKTTSAALAGSVLVRVGAGGRDAAALQEVIDIRAAGFVEAQDQLEHTLAVLEAYAAQHPDVSIQPEFTDYGSFTDKLATEAAGGNMPDLVSTNLNLMSEYSRRGAIRTLNEYVPDPIDLSSYAEGTVLGNTIDGNLFGIPNDCMAPSLVYDTSVFAETGIPVPEQMWTWEEYAQLANDLSAAKGQGFYGTEDEGGSIVLCDMFFRGRGKRFSSDDLGLDFNEDDLAAWYDFWQQLRESGGTPPGEVQALATGDDLARNTLVTGRAAILPEQTATFVGLQALTENKLGLHMVPNGFAGGTLEQLHYIDAGNSTSISAGTEHPEIAIDIIRFMHFDPEGSAIYFQGSGLIPPSVEGRALLREAGAPAELTVLDYVELLLSSTAAPRNPAVPGVSDILRRMNEAVAFGQLTVTEAAAQFFAEAASRIS